MVKLAKLLFFDSCFLASDSSMRYTVGKGESAKAKTAELAETVEFWF